MNDKVETKISIGPKTRKAFAFLGTSILIGLLGVACEGGIEMTTTYPPTPVATLAPTPTMNPREPILLDIASQAREAGKQTAFTPEGNFSQEFFEKVRKSTFVIRAESGTLSNLGSAWALYKDNDAVYFAASFHTLELGGSPQKLYFQRPFIDAKPFTSIAWDEIPDTEMLDKANPGARNVVIRCSFPKSELDSIPVLPHINNYSFKQDENVLIVGFPDEFKNKENKSKKNNPNLDYITQGQVLSIRETPGYGKGLFVGYGPTDRGISGSPVVVNSRNEPVVVGIVWGINLNDNNVDRTLITELNFPLSLQ